MSPGSQWSLISAAVVLGGLLATGCASSSVSAPERLPRTETASPPYSTAPATPPSVTSAPSAVGAAAAMLPEIPVKGRAAKTGYERGEFGPAWADTDRNGCDTRNDILHRDLSDQQFRPNTHDCVVVSGRLHDPYTGTTIPFTKARAGLVQIDHVVALSNAWQSGAQLWPYARRLAFANDPLNLLAVAGAVNQAKGAGDAATWLPPDKAFRCPYIARQIAVKHKYDLWVTPAEQSAMDRILRTCPGQPAPAGTASPLAPVAGAAQDSSSSPPPTAIGRRASPSPSAGSLPDPRFPSCAQAKAHGLGNYIRGQDPEYDWYRDGDGDGVVCE